MNWKTDLRLNDLDDATEIEIVCKRCGVTRTLRAAQITVSVGRWLKAFDQRRIVLVRLRTIHPLRDSAPLQISVPPGGGVSVLRYGLSYLLALRWI